MRRIQTLRGIFAKKPVLKDGEMYVAKDTKQVFVGDKDIDGGEFNIVEDNTVFSTVKSKAETATTNIENLTIEVNEQASEISNIQADYMQTTGGNIVTKNSVIVSNANGKATALTGTSGQYVGFNANGIPTAVDLDSIEIAVSETQPTGQKAGDFWYQVTGTL